MTNEKKPRIGATPWMIDCEFNENGPGVPIELISIALVSDDGREYYAADERFHPTFDPEFRMTASEQWTEDARALRRPRSRCNDWVKRNVLPCLPDNDSSEWKSRAQIKEDIIRLVTADHERPEFWGYYADYDWVLFCQLFGKMVDLPVGFPFFCMDLKQHMLEYGVSSYDMPEDREGFVEHHALWDARKQMDWLTFVNRFYRRYV